MTQPTLSRTQQFFEGLIPGDRIPIEDLKRAALKAIFADLESFVEVKLDSSCNAIVEITVGNDWTAWFSGRNRD